MIIIYYIGAIAYERNYSTDFIMAVITLHGLWLFWNRYKHIDTSKAYMQQHTIKPSRSIFMRHIIA